MNIESRPPPKFHSSHILWEDNHIIVVSKAIGTSCQIDKHNPISLPCLIEKYLCKRDKKPGRAFVAIVQRLDKLTSGVMVLAKTSKAAKRLNQQFQLGKVIKRYIALTLSPTDFLPRRGLWQDFLVQDKEKYRSSIVSQKYGKVARLVYQKLDFFLKKHYTVFLVRTYTGRYHQVRIQFSGRGVPLIGDKKYGFVEPAPKKNSKHPMIAMRGLGLHSLQLKFSHPVSKEKLSFTCPPPSNWPKNVDDWFQKVFL